MPSFRIVTNSPLTVVTTTFAPLMRNSAEPIPPPSPSPLQLPDTTCDGLEPMSLINFVSAVLSAAFAGFPPKSRTCFANFLPSCSLPTENSRADSLLVVREISFLTPPLVRAAPSAMDYPRNRPFAPALEPSAHICKCCSGVIFPSSSNSSAAMPVRLMFSYDCLPSGSVNRRGLLLA